MHERPKVVIIGAGFAGLSAAKALKGTPVEILLIDQNNYHTFQPLLYQVATSGLDTGDIAYQVRGIFQHQPNFNFRQGRVVAVDKDAKQLQLEQGATIHFDYLIIAAGASDNDFGIPGVREYGFFLKSINEAVNIRSHVLRQFEKANADPACIDQGALTFVLVGAGPTGVELSGAFVELFELVLRKDFPKLDMSRAKVILLEATGTVLRPYHPDLQRYTERVLRERGVFLRLNAMVSEVKADAVLLQSGERIPAQTLIWAAGVRAHPLAEALDAELTRGFRLAVTPELHLPSHPDIFVTGDMAGASDSQGNLYPQVAQVAMQQGKHAARQIRADIGKQARSTFRYRDLGNMATIGRSAAVAELSPLFGNLRFQGLLAWLAWLFLHLVYLIGHQNRLRVFINWAYNYFTYDRHTRLITFLPELRPEANAASLAPQPSRNAKVDSAPANTHAESGNDEDTEKTSPVTSQ